MKSNGRVKYNAYLPNNNDETSVYRLSGIENELDIWKIGDKYVREPRSRNGTSCTIYGRSEVSAEIILDNNLSITPQPTPHPRHADITNWPEDKPQKQMKATVLADESVLILI